MYTSLHTAMAQVTGSLEEDRNLDEPVTISYKDACNELLDGLKEIDSLESGLTEKLEQLDAALEVLPIARGMVETGQVSVESAQLLNTTMTMLGLDLKVSFESNDPLKHRLIKADMISTEADGIIKSIYKFLKDTLKAIVKFFKKLFGKKSAASRAAGRDMDQILKTIKGSNKVPGTQYMETELGEKFQCTDYEELLMGEKALRKILTFLRDGGKTAIPGYHKYLGSYIEAVSNTADEIKKTESDELKGLTLAGLYNSIRTVEKYYPPNGFDRLSVAWMDNVSSNRRERRPLYASEHIGSRWFFLLEHDPGKQIPTIMRWAVVDYPLQGDSQLIKSIEVLSVEQIESMIELNKEVVDYFDKCDKPQMALLDRAEKMIGLLDDLDISSAGKDHDEIYAGVAQTLRGIPGSFKEPITTMVKLSAEYTNHLLDYVDASIALHVDPSEVA